MGYALNLMKLAVSVALMVPLAIEVTVWLQQPPKPWQRFEQADGRHGDETSFAARWAALPWEASFQMLMLKRESAR